MFKISLRSYGLTKPLGMYQATGYASQHTWSPSQDKLGGLRQEGYPA